MNKLSFDLMELSQIEKVIARIEELLESYHETYAQKLRDVESSIEQLEALRGIEKDIVTLRCIKQLTFKEIAAATGYSQRHVQRIYHKAVKGEDDQSGSGNEVQDIKSTR